MPAKLETTRYPGIYRRGSRYVVVWRHKGRQHRAAYRTIAEAREAQGRRRSPDERQPATRERFEDYARAWLDTYQGRTSRGLGELTREGYRNDLERWAIPYFRGQRLAEVEPPDVRAFVSSMERKKKAPATIRKALAPVRAMFATAVEDGALRVNPTVGVRVTGRRGGEPDREVRALTRGELAAFLAEVPEEWRLFFELLAHTGLRISEALGLQWGDVKFGEPSRLEVRRQMCKRVQRGLKTKNARRDLPLSPAMARRLWALSRGHTPTDPLFVSAQRGSRGGVALNESNVRCRVLNPATERAGVPWATFHTFRHTCASLLVEDGKNLAQVAGWLGHADPAFTLRTYIHLMDNGLGAADFLDMAVKAAEGDNWVTTHGPVTAANGAEATEAA